MIKIINSNYLDDKDYIAHGSEGIIFKKDKIATKIFTGCYNSERIIIPPSNNSFFEIKKRKLLLLKDIIIEEKVNIVSLLEIYGMFCGYNMEYFEPYSHTEDLDDYIRTKTLIEKIEILIKISQYIQKAHQKNLAIGDLRTANIIIDQELMLHFVDTDGYRVGEYDCECIPSFVQIYNCIMKKSMVDANTDKFSFGLMCLDLMTDYDVYNNLNLNKIIEYLDTLELPDEIKRIFQNLFSKDPQKVYLEEQLREIKPDENDFYLKIKRK